MSPRHLISLTLLAGVFGCGSPPDEAGAAATQFVAPDAAAADGQVDRSMIDGGSLLPLPDEGLPDSFTELPLAAPVLSALAPYDAPVRAFFTGKQAARATPPISGGTLATSASGKVVASDPDRDLIYVIDLARKQVESVPLQAGQEPGRVVIENERAYVALRSTGTLLTIDFNPARVSQTTPVCAAPRGVALDRVANRLLVACAGGDLVSVSPDGARVIAKVYVAPDLRDVGRDANGVWVSQFRAAQLLRLDDELHLTAQQSATKVSGPFANTRGEFLPTLAWRTVAGADGEPVMLHQRALGSVLPTQMQGSYGNASSSGSNNANICEGGVVHTTLSRFGGPSPSSSWPLLQAVLPSDLAFAPDGKRLAVVAPGNFARQDGPAEPGANAQQLYVMTLDALNRAPSAGILSAGECLDMGRREHRFPGEATAVAFADPNTLLVYVRNPAELHVLRFDDQGAPRLSAVIALNAVDVSDSGHEIFHQNTGKGIACASCHGEALDDGHVWTFDSGPRRTQSVRGSVVKHAPFHWSADQSDLGFLLSEVYQRRMGGRSLSVQSVDALSHWLESSGYVPAEPGDAATVARGRALFESAEVGCASCHAGPELRMDGLYDVGTGGRFKVPSLRGVALRLPLMHSGCADKLEKRFDPACGGTLHGSTLQLGPAQLADLVAYLASL